MSASETFSRIGFNGTITRPSYNSQAQNTAIAYTVKMGLQRLEYFKDMGGELTMQKFVALIPKNLLVAAGWTNGDPMEGDVIECDGCKFTARSCITRDWETDRVYAVQGEGRAG